MNDVAYFAKALELGVFSIVEGVSNDYGTEQDCWDILTR